MAKVELSENLKETIKSVVDGWYSECRIDWEDALYRIELMSGEELGDSMTSPLIEAIKRFARKYKALPA